jgi:hypothetical protein
MRVERSIRLMTSEELRAKREWGTGGCQSDGCTARAGYLVLEVAQEQPAEEEWWQYCCPEHARLFAQRYDLQMPA